MKLALPMAWGRGDATSLVAVDRLSAEGFDVVEVAPSIARSYNMCVDLYESETSRRGL